MLDTGKWKANFKGLSQDFGAYVLLDQEHHVPREFRHNAEMTVNANVLVHRLPAHKFEDMASLETLLGSIFLFESGL